MNPLPQPRQFRTITAYRLAVILWRYREETRAQRERELARMRLLGLWAVLVLVAIITAAYYL